MFNKGMLVQYGRREGLWRAGVIIGHFRDELMGEIYGVRTPHAALIGQQYDPVPIEEVKPATLEDLARSAEIERGEIVQRLSEYMDEITSTTTEPA